MNVSVSATILSAFVCMCACMYVFPSRSLSFRFHSYSVGFFVYFVIIATSAGIGSGLGLATSYIGLGLRHCPLHSHYSLYTPRCFLYLFVGRTIALFFVRRLVFWFRLCVGFIAVALYNCNLQWHFYITHGAYALFT